MRTCILLMVFCQISVLSSARIWRVNNIPGIIADFSSPQAAHDAATAGDTIHLETSSITYNSFSATKPLVWIGNGYFVDGSRASAISDIYFSAGSANSVIRGICVNNSINVYTHSITLNRCFAYTVYLDASVVNRTHDFTMNQCFISSGGINYQVAQYYYSPSVSYNYTFTNNCIMGTFNLGGSFSNAVMVQNYIQNWNTSSIVSMATNNIINTGNSSQQLCTYASNVYNNLFLVNTNLQYVGSNGNIYSAANPANGVNAVFTSGSSFGADTWLTLKSGSPAIGAGLGGENLGPLGGLSPYKLSGIPSVPSFSQFQFQGSPTNTLPIIISTKSNN